MTKSTNIEPWEFLFDRAIDAIEAAQLSSSNSFQWSIGGGTVLMFRYDHRLSKDIDIFLEDRQLLGFFNPVLQDHLADVSAYEVGTVYSKLTYNQGDIDFIFSNAITDDPYESAVIRNKTVLLQTPAEIVARKLFYRGQLATARDLYDLAVVAQDDPLLRRKIQAAINKSGEVFLNAFVIRREYLEIEFSSIASSTPAFTYDEALDIARAAIMTKKA